jgi:quinol-cytochrome oxidoreductase complex cytochrome b subunit
MNFRQEELKKAIEGTSKKKNLKFYSMWRYASITDICLMVIGLFIAVGCSIFPPFINYRL